MNDRCTLGLSNIRLCPVHGVTHPTAAEVLDGRLTAAMEANAAQARADFADRARAAGEGRT